MLLILVNWWAGGYRSFVVECDESLTAACDGGLWCQKRIGSCFIAVFWGGSLLRVRRHVIVRRWTLYTVSMSVNES